MVFALKFSSNFWGHENADQNSRRPDLYTPSRIFHVENNSQGIFFCSRNPPGVIWGVDNKRTNANLAPFKLDLKTLDVF